jgi:hypothetical protein
MSFLVFRYIFKNEYSLIQTSKIYVTSSPYEELLLNMLVGIQDSMTNRSHSRELLCKCNVFNNITIN